MAVITADRAELVAQVGGILGVLGTVLAAVATVAELSLVAQWTIFLREYARAARKPPAVILSFLPLGLIAMAEIFSWYTTLTTNFIGSVVEESTWAVTASVFIIGLSFIWSSYRGSRRRLIGLLLAINVAYFIFMCRVDVPMYWSRFTADRALGKQFRFSGAGAS